jgi:hypothetical protein
MVRLDRTIGVSKLSLTGVFGLMVRSSRTLTCYRRRPFHPLAVLALMRLDPSMTGERQRSPGQARARV